MTDWNKLKVVDLKAELANRGLPQTGLKAALVARLVAADEQDGSESEATIQDDSKHDASSVASPDTVASGALPQSEPNHETLPQEVEKSPSKRSQDDGENASVQTGDAPFDSIATSNSVQDHVAHTDDELNATSQTPKPKSQTPTDHTQPQESLQNNSVEKPALSEVESQATIEDRLKRKRRSQSPPPIAEDIARKRFKTEQSTEPQDEVVTTEADAEWVEQHNAMDQDTVNAEATEVDPAGGVLQEPTIVDSSREEVIVQPVTSDQARRPFESMPDSPAKPRDSRFTGLFAQSSTRHESPEHGDVNPDRDIEPAIHPATSALYIKDLMRPLQAPLLQSHLAMLATAPGHDTDPDVILNFYLDPIKTHAFVIFRNISAAARVRNAFHDRIWPDEKNRKKLWVDFVPAEKAEDWIAEEMATNNGPRSQKKWEVDYRVGEDHQVSAVLQEAAALRPIQPVRQPVGPSDQGPPSRWLDPPSGPRRSAQPPPQPAMNVARLNELFESTTTKPVLYFQPVKKELANKRLDNIDLSLSKDASAGRRIVGDIHRYTFEDGDQLVDRGPEIFSGIRPPPNVRGSRGGGRGGPPPFRDSYSRRDGRRDGGYGDRRADTYRNDRRDGRYDRRY